MKCFARLLPVVMLLAALALVVPAPVRARSRSADSAKTTAMPTQATIRQQIVDEFKRRLAKIDSAAAPLANGYQYQTDIGKNPIDEWATNYNDDQLKSAAGQALISVFDQTRSRPAKSTPDARGLVAELVIQTRSYHFRDLTPAAVRKHLADMQQAIVTDPDTGKRDLQLGGLAVDVEITDDGFVIPNNVFTIEAAAVSWKVTHVIEPYAQ